MSSVEAQIGIMQEIDPNHLEKMVDEAKYVITDFGYYDPNNYNIEQLCVVVYGNDPNTMCSDASTIDPTKFDWTAMIMMMIHNVNDKLTPITDEEVDRLRVAYPHNLGVALAYLSISRSVENEFQALSIEYLESGDDILDVAKTMAKDTDVDTAITYVYNTIYEDFYKFIANS